jgi:hypothetical protein
VRSGCVFTHYAIRTTGTPITSLVISQYQSVKSQQGAEDEGEDVVGEEDGGVGNGRNCQPSSAPFPNQPAHGPQRQGQQRPGGRFGQIAAKIDVVALVRCVHVGHGGDQRGRAAKIVAGQQVSGPTATYNGQGKGQPQTQVQIANCQIANCQIAHHRADQGADVVGEGRVKVEEGCAVPLGHVGRPAAVEDTILQQAVQLHQPEEVKSGIVRAGERGVENGVNGRQAQQGNGQSQGQRPAQGL